MRATVWLQSLGHAVLLTASALPASAMAQVVAIVENAASQPQMYREAPGYPWLPTVVFALFGLFALMGLLATVCTVMIARRNGRLESLVEELIRAEGKRADLQDAERRTRGL